MTDAARILGLVADGQVGASVWLDGGPSPECRGVFGDAPDLELRSDELAVLDDLEERFAADPARVWMGFLTYELGVDALFGRRPVARALPGACLRRFAAVLRLRGDDVVEGVGDPSAIAGLRSRVAAARVHVPGAWPLGPLRAVRSPSEYRARVASAKERIAAGDTYQINLSQPFVAPWTDGDRSSSARAADVYATLRARRPATMGGLLGVDGSYVVSNSPETLVDVRFGSPSIVRAWPIKGSIARGDDPPADAAAKRALLASEKDRAEHVMIVDLVRNDLGRVCRTGSVHASREPTVLTLPTVHHLVTEVRGELSPGVGLATLVRAVFPGGSITGAPKHKTCEIIETLEDIPRGIYCGALVLLEREGLRMSIPIRTGWLDEAGLRLHAGGGIVIDSDPEAERAETELKTRAFAPP